MIHHQPSPMYGLTYRVPLHMIQAWMSWPLKTVQSQIAWVVSRVGVEHRALVLTSPGADVVACHDASAWPGVGPPGRG
jgi:hypothetical protein